MRDWCSDRAGALRRLGFAGLLAGLAGGAVAQTAADLTRQAAEFAAGGRKTIFQLQPLRRAQEAVLADGAAVRLVALNPGVNAWFVLELGPAGKAAASYHIENPDPGGQQVDLAPDGGLELRRDGAATRCDLLSGDAGTIGGAKATVLPFAPLCDGRLFLRQTTGGARSARERVTDFLRDHVWGGDAVVNFVKETFYRDAYAAYDATLGQGGAPESVAGPLAAPLEPGRARPVIAGQTGFGLSGAPQGRMALGLWYPVAGLDGVFAAALLPGAIDPAILAGPGRANRLDAVEAGATDYFVAFDLARYTLGFALGTDHPRLDWSPRPPAAVRLPGLPGPDGLDTARPVVRLGMVPPWLAGRTVATFAGGFKRHHGAFRWGPLSTVNAGSHYGFVEEGAIFSKLQPGLATLYGLTDGTVGMKTWEPTDDALLPQLGFARQNGVALVVPDPAGAGGLPGPLVTQWGAGNWSGSAEAALRTLRAGACLQQAEERSYLIYGYFTSATPSAMARTFQAFGCSYAMLLDMNAPELTYLALYVRQAGLVQIEHLVPEMEIFDRADGKGKVVPRFLGYPDSRDLFYVLRRDR